MFENPSLITRIAVGKLVGFVFGLAGFICIPYLFPDVSLFFRWGILLWYITVGAIVGVFGVITYHPIIRLPMPWWILSPLLGAWMNFILVFFTFDVIQGMMTTFFGEDGVLTSPFWFAAEGAFVGFTIGYFATRFAGEGKEAAGR